MGFPTLPGFYGLPTTANRVLSARQALADQAARNYDDRIKAHKQRIRDEQASRAGVVTINQAEVTFIELNIWAFDTLGESFAETAQLQFGQQAVYKNRYHRPIRVNLGNLAGNPPGFNFLTVQSHTDVPTFEYFSEEYEVPNLVNTQYDLEKFQEKEEALKRVAHDLRLYRQKLTLNMMMGAPLTQTLATTFANYYASTPYSGRLPFVADADIPAGAIPQTNILNSIAEGGLTRNVFKQQRTWANQMDRELRSMFVPTAGAPWEAYWNQASIVGYSATGNSNLDTSKAIPPSQWEDAIRMGFKKNGALMNWFGSTIFVQPVNILPQGYCLISTDQPAVLIWDKLQDAVSDEERIFGNRNMNRRYERRSLGIAQPDLFLTHFLLQKVA